MDKAELAKVFKHLDRMDDRVRKVLAKRPLQLDNSPRPAPRPKIQPKVQRQAFDYTNRPAIATGQLEGHEMELPSYEPPGCRDEAPGFDYTRDVIFAGFNRSSTAG